MDPRGAERASTIAARTLSLVQVGTALGGDVAEVVERMHGAIVRRPLPLGRPRGDLTRGLTRLVYAAVRGGFDAATWLSGAAARRAVGLTAEDDDRSWIALCAALNGVLGDRLEAMRSPLAQPMRLVARRGSGRTLVLFVHGLCTSEYGWRRGEFSAFESWCVESHGAQTGHLRYNSGRRVVQSGIALAALLDELTKPEAIERLVLIGHSMGGLVIRSACHQALEGGMAWPARVSHVATLGTPHHGAQWERLGHFANGLLAYSPYTAPLGRLGDVRSAGIKDLRYGSLLDEACDERPAMLPLSSGTRHLFVAATRSPAVPEPVWRGRDDMLVPVASALGLSRDARRQVDSPDLDRYLIPNLDHLALMGDPRVYEYLRRWLTGVSPPGAP